MNTLVYALRDFFEFTFTFMPKIGAIANILFSSIVTIFTVYWIREMLKHKEKTQ